MIELDPSGGLTWVIKHLKPSWPRIFSLLFSYIRFRRQHRRNFVFLSQGPISSNVKITIYLSFVATAVALAWAYFLSRSLGEPLYKATFLFIRTVVIFDLIMIGVAYCVARFLFRKRIGLFLVNLTAVSQIWMTVASASILLTGAVASGHLYNDILETRSGTGRETAFYHAYCEPVELRLQAATLALNLERQLDELDSSRASIIPDDGTEIQAAANQHLHALERRAHLTRTQLRIVLARQQIWETRPYLWNAWNEYAIGVVLLGLYILLIVIFGFWNFIFVASALRGGKAGWGAGFVAFIKAFVVYSASALAVYPYVQAAEGTPIWQSDEATRESREAKAAANRIQPFCGRITDKFESRLNEFRAGQSIY